MPNFIQVCLSLVGRHNNSAISPTYTGAKFMKTFPLLIIAGSLLCAAPLASACPAGQYGSMGMSTMDKNGDGDIDKKEFTAFHEQRFQEMDANHDGKISRDEMANKYDCKMKDGKNRFDTRFDEVDINGDGALSKDEAEIGMPMLFSRFSEIDSDKDGKISKEEVMTYMQKSHPQHKQGMQRKY
ncbi:MAG: EF-hand domain-containing protein [Sideroxydans sp.]